MRHGAIGDYAFDGCINLKEVCLPESVVEIGESAFAGCENLEEINIPNSVREIDYSRIQEQIKNN